MEKWIQTQFLCSSLPLTGVIIPVTPVASFTAMISADKNPLSLGGREGHWEGLKVRAPFRSLLHVFRTRNTCSPEEVSKGGHIHADDTSLGLALCRALHLYHLT